MLRYAITDRTRLSENESLIDQAARLAAQGIDFIQLREKDLPAGTLATLAREILATLQGTQTKLLINSRADIAIATAAHGVHLTSAPGALTPMQIRSLYAHANLPEPTVSVSCHTLAEAARAREEAATLILFGPVFEKRIRNEKVAEGIGLELLQATCASAGQIPVLALGGVTHENTAACLEAGAAGIGAIRLFA